MSNFFLWLGAGISVAEIEAGRLFFGLNLDNAIFTIIFGHFLGAILFFAMAYISANLQSNAMKSVEYFYSNKGRIFFAALNSLALICWSGVMIMSAARLLVGIFTNFNYELICFVLALILFVWMFLKHKILMNINNVVVFVLFLICIYVFTLNDFNVIKIDEERINIFSAIELSIAMPISWLALVGDYAKNYKNPFKDSFIATFSYFIGSSFMYMIGYLSMQYFSDLLSFLISIKVIFLVVFLIIFSTITTTYLDIFSASKSLKNINNKFDTKITKLIIILLALVIAVFIPFALYEKFLYTLSSVFLPMASIMIVVYFFKLKISAFLNFFIWLLGFLIYQILIYYDFLASILTFLIILILILGGNYVSTNYAKYKK